MDNLQLAELYAQLMESQFAFMRPGEHKLSEVLGAVQGHFPAQCDDTILCAHYKKGSKIPEWQHRVRNALKKLKEAGVARNQRRGYWSFSTDPILYPDEGGDGEVYREHAPFILIDNDAGSSAETPESIPPLVEGAAYHIELTAFERNPESRRRCLGHYGTRCIACEFDFGATYGAIAHGFIHIHHLVPLSELGDAYVVDPIADLKPLCPNCHAVAHLRTPPYTIEEIKAFLAAH